MQRIPLIVLVCLVVASLSAQETAKAPVGFSRSSADALATYERIVLDTPSPANAKKWLEALTEVPHVAGTPTEKKVADYVRDRMVEFGLAVEMVKYDVFLNHPKLVSLTMTSPSRQELSLMEDTYPQDTAASYRGQFPAFHGYGASGVASGQVIYVNYGAPGDHERLKAMGLSVEGKIALVRYGGAFRGLKVKEAEERGAVGVIIYPIRPTTAHARRCVSGWTHASGLGDSARFGAIPVDSARRPLHSRRRAVHRRRCAHHTRPDEERADDPVPADFASRGREAAAATGRTAGARRLAGRVAVFVSRGARRSSGRDEGGDGRGVEAHLQRHGHHSRHHRSGPGRRQPSRCVDAWRD
ncbi:MAG: hypothetical protein IPL75_00020 [Acidobacteria bacterium]|nr:hypothetical protein [Acidobacteriota bacterium]